ncbi:MAG: 3-oxoadipyl-CoA thiolase [Sphingomonadales bacterium]|nr:3-oxoadipyl-CoA thiolase [Sphingomonadales bacterium]
MKDVYICDGIRTPVGRYGGGLSSVRADDLAAIPISELMRRNPDINWGELDDVIMGDTNQAGEDCRNVARMAALLSGLPVEAPGVTVNRLCGSGMEATAMGARAIATGEAEMIITGGVENMSRAPFVMPKATSAFSRNAEIYDTTLGNRFVNPKMKEMYGAHVMGKTAENLAEELNISREDQDAFAHRSQERADRAINAGRFEREIVPVEIPQRKGEPQIVAIDEHPRLTSLEKLSSLRAAFRDGGTVTAGNASGVNDGAAALLLANEDMVKRYNLRPLARIMGAAVAGVPPRTMGIGPVPATHKLLTRLGLIVQDMDIVELNEAFAAQALACTRGLGLDDDAHHVNPNGGGIALGHPLGMSGARLILTAMHELKERDDRYALTTMCIGVGQGIAMVIERV